MLAHHLRRKPNIQQALGERLVSPEELSYLLSAYMRMGYMSFLLCLFVTTRLQEKK